ncbi:MAG: 1-phosphofructokinase [Spirochaetes bacterium]|nr:1-phosphofructokinase [Spirochaetota bacterium]
MTVTLTLNPALDKTANLDALKPGAMNRLQNIRLDGAGKGLNVSAVLHALGGDSIALGFAGGNTGDHLLSLFAQKGVKTDFVRIAGETRTNLKVNDAQGSLTELNEPGPKITDGEWRQLEEKLIRYAKRGNTLVLSGSLPPGLGGDTYKKLSSLFRDGGAAVFLDADREAQKLALDSSRCEVPNYIKPNRFELLQYFGIDERENVSDGELAKMCVSLLDKGIELVALSMGAGGAIFANKNGVWRAPAIKVEVRSTVGAGDSVTAGLLYGFGQGMPDEQCFALALATSAAACTTEGTNPPDRALVDSLLAKTRIEKIS